MTCVHYQRWWNNDESHGTMKTGTSHLVYGEAAADSPMVTTTSTTMQDNRAGGWGAAYFPHSNKHDDGSGGTDHTASTLLPYDTTTRYIPRGVAGGCTLACTLHPVYGKAAAASTVVATTARTMFGNTTYDDDDAKSTGIADMMTNHQPGGPCMAATTPYKSSYYSHSTSPSYTNHPHNRNKDDHCIGGWGAAYAHLSNSDDNDAKPNDEWGGTTMTTNDGDAGVWGAYSQHNSNNCAGVLEGAAYSHHSNKQDDVWGDHTMTTNGISSSPHQRVMVQQTPTMDNTTTTTLRVEDPPVRNSYGRLQFDRGPNAPTTPTPPQAPTTKPSATTMTAAAPMVAASSTPVYGSRWVGEWGAYHHIHGDDSKADDWNTNVIMMAIPGGTRVSHSIDMMIPHPLSHFHAGLYCFPVLVYKGQATPSSSSFSSLDPCTLLHTVQWKGSSSEFHFPNVPKVAHLSVFLFGPRNALVPSPSCILPVKVSREVGSNSTCSYVEF